MSKTQKLTSRTSLRIETRPVNETPDARSYLFYGRSGTGKTTLAASFPKPLLLIDVTDEGTDSISDVEKIDVLEARDFEEVQEAYWYLSKNPTKYKTVVIDTVTQLQTMSIVEVLEKKKKQVTNVGDWGTMTKREWGDVSALMKEWLINFRDLTSQGINIIFIAQDRVFNLGDEEEDVEGLLMPEVGPSLSPSVAKALNAAVSVIGNTFIRGVKVKVRVKNREIVKSKTEYCLRIGPNPIYTTKVRKPKSIKAPDFLTDPTYDDLIDLITGE